MSEALPIYTVSQLCRESRILLEQHFFEIQIEGEISNLARPASGHLYFSLKDANAQVQCAMFRPRMRGMRFQPDNGQQVLLRARVSLYEQRGNFQLIVEHMEPAGDGALRLAYERLKQKLQLEGLFDANRKMPLPAFPKQIGVITSPTGAVIRDILTVLRRRFPALPVLVYPISVQGDMAKSDIVAALTLAQQRAECDVLILARGGGSLEDLWAFNEESVARALADCTIPVVSAVGHEVDFTIADLVADHRAPTPSAAAELVSQDQSTLTKRLSDHQKSLFTQMQRRLQQHQQTLDWTQRHLRRLHPGLQLKQQHSHLEHRKQQLCVALQSRLSHRMRQLQLLTDRLQQRNPASRIAPWAQLLNQLQHRLKHGLTKRIDQQQQQFQALSQQLHMVSPLATLQRGYSITEDVSSGRIVRSDKQIKIGQNIRTRLAEGTLISTIEDVQTFD